MAKPKQRRRGRRKSRFSPSRGLVSVLLSIVTLAVLGAALITESILLLVVSALSSLATAAQIRWSQKRAENELRTASAPRVRPKTSKPRPTTPKAEGEPAAQPVTGGAVVLCTESGRPVSECECASRHVATADGAKRYGLPIGSPMGRRAKKSRTPATVQRG